MTTPDGAVQITELSGPDTALRLVECRSPRPRTGSRRARASLIDVRAAGVSFPELLQTTGLYQVKPALPFIPGSEVAGSFAARPQAPLCRPGDRVAAFA